MGNKNQTGKNYLVSIKYQESVRETACFDLAILVEHHKRLKTDCIIKLRKNPSASG